MSVNTPPLNPHEWVENHADYLYAFALSRLNDEELARDLVQDTFFAALKRIDAFEGKSTERTWLTAILKYKIIDCYRKQSSAKVIFSEKIEEPHFFEEDGHWAESAVPVAFGIESDAALNQKELNGVLQDCMQKLPALWLSVFTMKHVDEELTETICTELKISASNFWVIIHRAKVNLRACLQKNWL
jgi:RNA polymerase sigma-70 factor (TIGR02943 family)